MNRPFNANDDGKWFTTSLDYSDGEPALGYLEFPLSDPGTARPGQGILWDNEGHWMYVSPEDVEEAPMKEEKIH